MRFLRGMQRTRLVRAPGQEVAVGPTTLAAYFGSPYSQPKTRAQGQLRPGFRVEAAAADRAASMCGLECDFSACGKRVERWSPGTTSRGFSRRSIGPAPATCSPTRFREALNKVQPPGMAGFAFAGALVFRFADGRSASVSFLGRPLRGGYRRVPATDLGCGQSADQRANFRRQIPKSPVAGHRGQNTRTARPTMSWRST